MLEDALKSTRNTYRLVLLVSAVIIVFSFSLSEPKELIEDKASLENALTMDFRTYDQFVADKVSQYSFEDEIEKFKAQLELDSLQIFGVDRIVTALQSELLVGKIIFANTIFSDMGASQISQLKFINDLPIEKNIELFRPELDSLAIELREYLQSFSGQNLSVENVIISTMAEGSDASTFYLMEDAGISIYFELSSVVSRGATPVFSAEISGENVEIPETSFIEWAKVHLFGGRTIGLEDGEVVFLSDLNLTLSDKQQTLGEALKTIDAKLEEFAVENQKISVLGIELPGILFMVSAPLLLLVLAYLLMAKVDHLLMIYPENIKDFQMFSWSVLTSGSLSKHETKLVCLAIPFVSLICILLPMFQYGQINYRLVLVDIVLAFTAMWFLKKAMNRIHKLAEMIRLEEKNNGESAVIANSL